MNDNNLGEFSIEEIRSKSKAERMAYISEMYISYPRANAIAEKIRYCFRARESSPEPLCVLLTGPSGSGKTTILEKILAENQKFIEDDTLKVPVVMATVDAKATIGSLASRLLDGFGDPLSESGVISKRIHRVEDFVECTNTKMILIDEIQHFIDQDNNKVIQIVSDTLKNLIKTKKLACVLCGMSGQAEKVVDSNPQLARLFPDPIVLEAFNWDERNPETIIEFRRILSEIDKIIPLREKSNLVNLETAWRIFYATDGLMGYLMKLIRISTTYALERGYEKLDNALFAEVFEEFLGKERRGLLNPFLGDPPPNRIIKSGHITNVSGEK